MTVHSTIKSRKYSLTEMVERKIQQAYNLQKSYCNYGYNTVARATSSFLYDGTKLVLRQGFDGMGIVIIVMS